MTEATAVNAAILTEYDFIVDAKTIDEAEKFATVADLVVEAIND